MMKRTVVHVSGWKTCPFYQKAANAVTAMESLYPHMLSADLLEHPNKEAFKSWLALYSHLPGNISSQQHTSSPFVWKNKNDFIGGCDDTMSFLRQVCFSSKDGENKCMTTTATTDDSIFSLGLDQDNTTHENKLYDYDLIVIGGGSGGLAASKEAASFGAKVAVLDYVKPSPFGSSWGLGGTCVNVGCIPKKLMHQSALIGSLLEKDAAAFGWKFGDMAGEGSENTIAPSKISHDWLTLVNNVQNHIKALNFKYRVSLREESVKYENFLGKFIDPHTLECTNVKKNKTKTLTARRFIIAVGGRPTTLDCPGGDLAISSDDIFALKSPPGNTLVVGASYVALECAGFLKGLGYPVTILVRSILLRGFDQDMASRIGSYMEEEEHIDFQRKCVPTKMESIVSDTGSKSQTKVYWKNLDTNEEFSGVFDTVLNATGRKPDVKSLGLQTIGVKTNGKSGKIIGNEMEQTSVPHIYAIGDVLEGANELTPVAVQSGRLLARRLYNKSTICMDYDKICTAVFTPIEYGSCGLTEEMALEKFGADSVEVYHQAFTPLEWTLSETKRKSNTCYVKLILHKADDSRVIGFHYLGPNSGEITQAVGIAMRLNASYQDFINTVGIHPTTAEVFTTLDITKRSGADASSKGC